MKVVDALGALPSYPRAWWNVPLCHQFRQPFPRLITMLDRNAVLFSFFCRECGVHAQVIVLAGCHDHVTALTEECRINGQSVLIVVQAFFALRLFRLLVEVRGVA